LPKLNGQGLFGSDKIRSGADKHKREEAS